jgi:hypothetical protein
MTGFEIGKRYKTRDGSVIATCRYIDIKEIAFEDDGGGLWFRASNFIPSGAKDFLPIEVKEPRKVEGFVWVNEYEENRRDTDYALGGLFGFDAFMYESRQVAEKCTSSIATRVAVKYKVTFTEVVDSHEHSELEIGE